MRYRVEHGSLCSGNLLPEPPTHANEPSIHKLDRCGPIAPGRASDWRPGGFCVHPRPLGSGPGTRIGMTFGDGGGDPSARLVESNNRVNRSRSRRHFYTLAPTWEPPQNTRVSPTSINELTVPRGHALACRSASACGTGPGTGPGFENKSCYQKRFVGGFLGLFADRAPQSQPSILVY